MNATIVIPQWAQGALAAYGLDSACSAAFNLRSCLPQFVSKSLGYGIIAGSAGVKLPQVAKVVAARSASGLSGQSLAIEMAAFVITLSYSVRQRFPFSTYGESAFLLLQDVVLALCIAMYSGALKSPLFAATGAVFAAYAGVMFSGVVPTDYLQLMQGMTLVMFTVSKLPQIYLCWRSKSAGQLSIITYALNTFGSVARIFTTLQEIDDRVILAGYVVGAVLNGAIAAQILYYGSAGAKENKKAAKKKTK
eukprot:m51a1_g7222 hypothetical protein (250) ;mRNA; f:8278-9666